MDKEVEVHIDNGVLCSHKKEQIGSLTETGMDQEIVIQS